MIGFVQRLFARAEPVLSRREPRDAAAIAALMRVVPPRLERQRIRALLLDRT